MRRTVTAIALAATALTLGACGGGATVDNQESMPTAVAPLTKTGKSEQPTSTSRPTSEPRTGGGAAAPAPQDGAVQEVSALPSAAPRPDKEIRLLDELKKQGINVDGVEDQMVSVADGVCHAGKANDTVGAVSGQLIEQKRTEKKFEDVTGILVKTAQEAYC